MSTTCWKSVASVAQTIQHLARQQPRFFVAIAGPPGAGKSTLAAELSKALPRGSAVVVPMDGFHYDNELLDQLQSRQCKGAPETFDLAGLMSIIKRIRAFETVAIPLFDRKLDLARAGATIVDSRAKFIIVEGNYLLLDEAPWISLAPMFDFNIFLDVPRDELEKRLTSRWTGFGFPEPEVVRRVTGNDMPNVDRVLRNRRKADAAISS